MKIPDVNKWFPEFIGLLIGLFILMLLFCPKAHADPPSTTAIIHHTVSHDVSAKEIDRWHKERGWEGIGYHFVIRKDGTVEEGRDIDKIGAHAIGRNQHVGIVLTGYDTFTEEQGRALIRLLFELEIEQVERHHEECPGPGLDVEDIQELLDSELLRWIYD